jgi:hypothetical protein
MGVGRRSKNGNYHMRIYDYPRYYEIAFSYRDIPAEADFIQAVIDRYSRVRVKSILELASGNSPHMTELCKRGYRYVGIELSDEMIDYSRETIHREKLEAQILKGDMIDFSLSDAVDCVAVFLGSFYIRSDADLSKHLESVANAIRIGGLYVLDAAVSYFPEDTRSYAWHESKAGIVIDATYEARWKDRGKRLMEATITLDVNDKGSTCRLRHTETRKMYSLHEFTARLQDSQQWQYIGGYSDFDIRSKPRSGRRNLTILRRK